MMGQMENCHLTRNLLSKLSSALPAKLFLCLYLWFWSGVCFTSCWPKPVQSHQRTRPKKALLIWFWWLYTLKLMSSNPLIFIFYWKKAFQKLWKMVFVSSKKLCSFSRYTIFFIFSPFLFTVSWFSGSDETGIIMTSWIGLHKLANVIFAISQTPLFIKSSKFPR